MTDPIAKGSIVQVQSRTWPGSNKPGGVARITAIHPPIEGSLPTTYDVAYVLGGKEKGVEEQYVTLQSADDSNDSKKKRGGGGGGSELHVSTSTASLALSASPLATPLDLKKEGSPMEEEEDEQVIEERRKRKNSLQEDILMGSSRNSSYNSLGVAAAAASNNSHGLNDNLKEEHDQPPQAKRVKIENEKSNSTEEAETSNDEDDSAASTSSLYKHHKTAIWSARKHLDIKLPSFESNNVNKGGSTTVSSSNNQNNVQRWRSHQIAEDYISLASAMILPPTTHLQTFGYTPHLGQYPIEQVTALGYLTSPLRRPSVIEKWSPYEITTFEAALALHGKHFHQVQKWIKTKNTKEVIEFYYIWKKTSHYRRWKSSFCEEMEESVCSSSSDDEGEDDNVVGRK